MSVAKHERKKRILVPGSAREAGGLILPGSVRQDRGPLVGKCLVPGCGAVFYAGQEDDWQRHVGACARENIDTIRELALKKRMPVFDPATWDPEIEQHMEKVGQRMKREGRLVVRPNERAGF